VNDKSETNGLMAIWTGFWLGAVVVGVIEKVRGR
jgi:hypothetical protein